MFGGADEIDSGEFQAEGYVRRLLRNEVRRRGGRCCCWCCWGVCVGGCGKGVGRWLFEKDGWTRRRTYHARVYIYTQMTHTTHTYKHKPNTILTATCTGAGGAAGAGRRAGAGGEAPRLRHAGAYTCVFFPSSFSPCLLLICVCLAWLPCGPSRFVSGANRGLSHPPKTNHSRPTHKNRCSCTKTTPNSSRRLTPSGA